MPSFMLEPRTSRSFGIVGTDEFIHWLIYEHHFTPLPVKGNELARLKRDEMLAVVFSHSVLCQGKQMEKLIAGLKAEIEKQRAWVAK